MKSDAKLEREYARSAAKQARANTRKKRRAIQYFNFALGLVMVTTALVLMLRLAIIGKDENNRLLSYFSVMILPILPMLVEKLFGQKFSDFFVTFYLVYIFFAAFLGNAFSFYHRFAGYDKVMHTIFGYIGCIVGLFIICKLANYKTLSAGFVAIMCLSVSMMCGALWEIIEFASDLFLGQTAQGIPVLAVDGTEVVSLTDTMLDLVCNLGGALLFVIHYVIHRKTKRNLFLGFVTADFSKKITEK